jgi:RNA polymerase sigma-70 factor (ECF subfamily)
VAGDDDLIRRAKAGDGEAWRELYRAHAGRLLVWLRAVAGHDAGVGAEDLAADAWLTAANKMASFEGSTDDFGGWLFGVARRLAANNRRRSERRGTWGVDPQEMSALAPTVEPHAEVDDQAWVRWALSGLPLREREVVACLEVIGLDVAATASALDMSAAAVRVARHRGLRRLRAQTLSPAPLLPIIR